MVFLSLGFLTSCDDDDATTTTKGTTDNDMWSDMSDNFNLLMASVASDGPGGCGAPRGDGPGEITDSTTWQANLESVLDVSEYLKWMAANTIIQNWDTYGNMTHKYYLYNDATTGLLNWIPWDNNEALSDNDRFVSLSLSLSEVTALWPLMNYVMTQDNYVAEYQADLQSFIDNVYNTSTMDALYSDYTALLTDYAAEENNTNFSSAVNVMKQHVSDRATAVSDYLSE